jgi:predicted DNA repair protein MutK
MASGFFALLDDIGALMDDVAAMSKITTKKTAGILGDDLAVNAEKASGFVASREIPVLWAITKGSMLNKLIILPIAFLLSAFLPWAVIVILVLGGIYLAYEGAEKIYEYIVPHKQQVTVENKGELSKEALLQLEQTKIKSAIVTDFILSVEIVIIALGTVVGEDLLFQILVVSIVAVIATIGVYGIVAIIVRMDDLGFRLVTLSKGQKNVTYYIGNFLVQALPKIIKSLSVIGTIALLLVAGGIFAHNLEFLHHFLEEIPSFIRDFVLGLAAGATALLVVAMLKKLYALLFNKKKTT